MYSIVGESVQCIHCLLYVLAMSPTIHREGLLHVGSLSSLCTYLQPWRSTAHSIWSFRTCTTPRMQLEGRNGPCKQYCASSLQHHTICPEDVTAVRRTLQRLHMCSRDTIASSTWSSPQNECQLIDIFYSLLAASICCHRSRHCCDTVIHACLQPTQGLCLKADLNFCVRPSGARLRPQHIAKDYCCGKVHYLVHLLTTVGWYST